jgi:hypothetical protein
MRPCLSAIVLTLLPLCCVALRPAVPRFELAGWMHLAFRLSPALL